MGATFDLDFALISGLEAVEIHSRLSEIPLEFQGVNASCGILVLWTRGKR